MKTASPPLAELLLAAAQAVAAVQRGTSLTEALARTPAPVRPGAQALAFHAMRRLGTARAVSSRLLPKTPPSPLVDGLLLVALALLEEGSSYAAHTVVDQAVQAAAGHAALGRYKGLVNACLRRFLRERDSLLAEATATPEGRWNHPSWWVAQLRRDHPHHWEDILRAADTPAPLTLRVNRRRATRARVIEALAASGIGAVRAGADGLVLDSARAVQQLPGFAEGWWSVQDAGAQLAAQLLPVRDGMRVLDACAAPGGKTAHLLERAKLDLLALDADAQRLARVGENLDRLGLSATLRAADAARPADWWDGKPFDAVLADVPCTASGIVRRHPDIRWLRRHHDLARTAVLQAAIADALWQVVAPGGTLLYVTCSLFPIEGERQAQGFASRHADAKRLAAPGQLLPAPAHAEPAAQHDGFFYALFVKS